jgi:hydrogenase nickel incorporation protein HypA/HybF
MHELSLASALIEQIQEILAREGAGSVARVTVLIGAMSGVEREAFEFAFPIVAEGGVADGAELIIEEAPIRVRCVRCEAESAPPFPSVHCTACASTDVTITAGRDFMLQSLEVR